MNLKLNTRAAHLNKRPQEALFKCMSARQKPTGITSAWPGRPGWKRILMLRKLNYPGRQAPKKESMLPFPTHAAIHHASKYRPPN